MASDLVARRARVSITGKFDADCSRPEAVPETTSIMIDETRLGARIGRFLLGKPLFHYELVTSTNDVAWELVARGFPEGTAVIADEQSAGRGRMGRRWVCPRGEGLLISIALSPDPMPGLPATLTSIAALSAASAVRRENLAAQICFPNDVVIRGRKVAGTLVERRLVRAREWFVMGIGVNLNCRPETLGVSLDRPATSLLAEKHAPIDRSDFAVNLLQELNRFYRLLVQNRLDAIIECWHDLLARQRNMTVQYMNASYSGEVVDIHPLYGLTLRLDSGMLKTFKGELVQRVR